MEKPRKEIGEYILGIRYIIQAKLLGQEHLAK